MHYILTKIEFISSCSRPAVGSNIVQITRATASSHFECPKITLYRISYHFRSIPQFLFLWIFFTKWLPKFTFDGICGHFRSIRNFFFFFNFNFNFCKMAAGGHFGCPSNNFRSHFWPFWMGTIMSIIELVRDIWMSNACVKFAERSLNPSKVIALTTKLWRGGGPRGGGVAYENIIFPKTYVSRNIIMSPDDSPHEAYCFYYVSTYVCMSAVRLKKNYTHGE